MKKVAVLSAVCAVFLVGFPCRAAEVEYDAFFQDTFYKGASFESRFFYDEKAGLSYKVLGNQEEGMIRFFVTPGLASRYKEEHPARASNEISPAAGIRFTVDFSL